MSSVEIFTSSCLPDLQRDTYQKTQAKKKAQKNKLRHAKPKETSRAKVPPASRAPFWASGATDQSSREPPTYDVSLNHVFEDNASCPLYHHPVISTV